MRQPTFCITLTNGALKPAEIAAMKKDFHGYTFIVEDFFWKRITN